MSTLQVLSISDVSREHQLYETGYISSRTVVGGSVLDIRAKSKEVANLDGVVVVLFIVVMCKQCSRDPE